MTNKVNMARKELSESEIDDLVAAQADDQSAWSKPVHALRTKPASLSIPADLAARAAFLARLHREKSLERYIARIVRERIELEELAFVEAKRQFAGNSH
jgi:hypothetical protein